MKHRSNLIAVAVIALLIGVVGVFIWAQQSDQSAFQESTQSSPTDEPYVSTKSTPQPLAAGRYIDYDANVIAKTPNTKLLFFHASWCRQCQQIETDIKSNGLPDGVNVIKVDYDSSPELRKKYGITLQTTFVRVNDNGDLIRKFVAYREPTFTAVARELL